MKVINFKWISIFVLGFTSMQVVCAQRQFRIGIAQDVIVPTGAFAGSSYPGNGVGILARYSITKRLVVGANTAYLWFGNKNSANYTIVVPLSGTLEYLFPINESLRFYTGFDVGYYGIASTLEPKDFKFLPGVAPFVGVSHPLSNRLTVFITVKYFNVFASNNVNASIAIGTGLTFRL
jgi:hypothetical protein